MVHRRKNKRLQFFIFLFFLVLATMAYLSSPLSKIEEIHISGNKLLSEKEIYQKANLQLNMQYLFARPNSIKEKLLQLNEMKDVNITKEFPGKLYINVEENVPVAFIYKNSMEMYPLLENGYISYAQNKVFANRPLVTRWENDATIVELAAQLVQVEISVLNEISEIKENPSEQYPEQVLIVTKEGYIIHISLKDIGGKLNLYPSIIENIKQQNDSLGDIYLLESMRFEKFNEENK